MLSVAAACLCLSVAAWSTASRVQSSTYAVPRGTPRISEDITKPDAGVAQSMSRRDIAGVAGIFAAGTSSASAEEADMLAPALAPVPVPVPAPVPAPVSARLQRVMVNVANDEALKNELKFWTEAAQMKVLKDFVDSDGNRTAIVGFGVGPSTGGDYIGVQVKVDPGLSKRPLPKLLNYNVMQPTVAALNFVQIGANGKVIEIFNRVQSSGGSSLFGDATYIDVESPRGVSVRLVPRTGAPSMELLSFNIEVPAFEPTVKFYQRAVGLTLEQYPDDEPPVQKLSACLGSTLGGPKVLLSPVPDGRLKEKNLDEFEGVVMVSPSAKRVAEAAKAAVVLAKQEEEEKKAKESGTPKKRLSYEEEREIRRTLNGAPGTEAKPSVAVDGATTVIDDGVGNFIFVTDSA